MNDLNCRELECLVLFVAHNAAMFEATCADMDVLPEVIVRALSRRYAELVAAEMCDQQAENVPGHYLQNPPNGRPARRETKL